MHPGDAVATRYSRRLGVALALTLLGTLAFTVLFAVHAAQNPAEAAVPRFVASSIVFVLNLGLLELVLVGLLSLTPLLDPFTGNVADLYVDVLSASASRVSSSGTSRRSIR